MKYFISFARFFAFLWIFASGVACADTLLVEAESFADIGGWVIDHQSIEAMGSPYLLAHGLGKPVADATTTVTILNAGSYRIFARTRDWVAPWKAPGTPGRFRLLVNGKPTDKTLGIKGPQWNWQYAGTVNLEKGETQLALHDLTGFEGRCDAIVLTDDLSFRPPKGKTLARWRKQMLGIDGEPILQGEYDVVVVGGGVAGCCSAISAARLGLSVALIQNRPVLGGNSSSEIRVWIMGHIHQEPYPILGEIVERLNPIPPPKSPGKKETFGDDIKRQVVESEENISLFLWEHVDEVRTKGTKISSVISRNVRTSKRSLFKGRWFVDCTGDGTIGFLAGADWERTEKGHLGSSNMWYHKKTDHLASFPKCPWAIQFDGHPVPGSLGHWNWESGFNRDTILDAEFIRDNNFRAMYGIWSYLKNVEKKFPKDELQWAAYISGRRESRRLLGDVLLTKEDILNRRSFPDACVTTTWPIDLHYPVDRYKTLSPDSPFISYATTGHKIKPYPVPYRCFYSRNLNNLFMAGRNISVTHEALGTTRVMATCGMMGEVIGRAAYLCKKHDLTPREIYEKRLDDLKALLKTSLFDKK